jgi:hypothetical protein
MNETHDGNLNKSKAPAPAKSEGTSGAKSNDCEASLRRGSLPPVSAVTTVDRDANKGKAIKCAQKQNTSDEKGWPKGRNVIPNPNDDSVLVADSGE